MVSREQFEIVRELVDDAVASGATLRCGGAVDAPAGLDGAFYAPAVLTGVTHDMRIMREEIFGPVLPIIVVDSEEEALTLANDSEFGLGASVWTTDRDKGERIAGELESGMVWINDHMFSHGACQCAWGGVKESGLGPHPLEVRAVRVRQRQAPRVGASAPSATPGGTPTTRRSAARCAAPRRSSTGGRRSARSALREGAAPLLKLGGAARARTPSSANGAH